MGFWVDFQIHILKPGAKMTLLRMPLLVSMLTLVSGAASAQVVISQIYGGAGCGTAGCST